MNLGQRLKTTTDELLTAWYSELHAQNSTHPLVTVQQFHLTDNGSRTVLAVSTRQGAGSKPLIRDMSPDARLCHSILADVALIDIRAARALEGRAGGRTNAQIGESMGVGVTHARLLLDRGYSLFKMGLWKAQPRRFVG